MAECVIVYWRDIPAQVIVRSGRTSAKRALGQRFIEAIDRTAMREGLAATDAYLDQWRRGAPVPCGTELDAEADAAVARIEVAYAPDVLNRLVAAGGRDSSPGGDLQRSAEPGT